MNAFTSKHLPVIVESIRLSHDHNQAVAFLCERVGLGERYAEYTLEDAGVWFPGSRLDVLL